MHRECIKYKYHLWITYILRGTETLFMYFMTNKRRRIGVMMFQQHFSYIVIYHRYIIFCVCAEQIGVLGESHWPSPNHFTTLVVTGTDSIGSCRFNYHTVTTTTAPKDGNPCTNLKWWSSKNISHYYYKR